jgi:o-succinylbenzoate synthase
MRVARVTWAPYRIPFVTPYETAHGGSATHRVGLILRLETDSGFVGLGEANLDPSRPEPDLESLYEPLERLARSLIGASPDEFDEVLETHATGDDAERAAHCAIETALADAGGRASGTSLATLLAHQFAGEDSIVHDRVRVNATIARQRTEAAAHDALLAVASGFSCIKLKVGMEPTIDAEVERVETIRQVIGADTRLRLDANGAWRTEDVAIASIRALEPQDIELIEQPIPPGDFDALDRVRAAVTVAIAADESVVDFATAEQAIHSADAVVLKPMRLGGASVTRYLAQFAAASGLGVVITTTIDAGIGTAMALHVAASLLDDGRAHGLATASLLRHDLLMVPLVVERGLIYLPSGPGLGVELDEDAVARYAGEWRTIA